MVSNQRVNDIKSPGPGLFNIGDRGTPSPKLKSVTVKKFVLVKIGKFFKIGIGIGMLFLLEEKIGMLFTLLYRYRYG